MDDRAITAEQAQQIINWAIGTGALLKLLEMRPADMPQDRELEALRNAFETSIDNMPDFFADFALDAGIELFEDYEEKERLIEEFKKELDEL